MKGATPNTGEGDSSPRVTELEIEGYRSINEKISIDFPNKKPVVLIGENNAGKSNIVRALDLLLGESWPGNYEPEDEEFWNRNRENKIYLKVKTDNFFDEGYRSQPPREIQSLKWTYHKAEDKTPEFSANRPGEAYDNISGAVRERIMCFTIEAERNLDYQMSYTSKYTMLSKLMRNFHKKLVSDEEREEELKNSYEGIKSIFREVERFADFEDKLSEHFGKIITGMSYSLEIDFSGYDPRNYFRSLEVQPVENGEIRTFQELGSGQKQLLALAFAQSYAEAFYDESIVLAIEEPESHLHPLAQKWLSSKISDIQDSGLQIVLTTHSPTFVNLLGLPGNVRVLKDEKSTITRQINSEQLTDFCIDHGADPEATSTETILPFYSKFESFQTLSGFFAKKIVLVEGQTESFSLPIYLEKVGYDVTKQGVEFIPVGGKGNLAKWWRLYRAYGFDVYITFDNDEENDSNGNRRLDVLETVNYGANKDEIIENESWIVKEDFCVFGEDYETSFREYFPEYESIESEVQVELGSSKPIVAKEVANRIELDNSEGWNKIRELAEVIQDLEQPLPDLNSAQDDDEETPF